ncbi:MAG: macro domain-containing protein [candidate division Zixibacteria bacterium]|nr:macro domain-containing protein [candidate division Zixibacteria bacterium]
MPFSIEIIRGDITHVDTEAIVNAANNEFWMGAGVAGAIKNAGGQSIEDDAMIKGPVMPGEAVFSTAGKLPYKYVIHAAVMGQDLRTNDKLIRQATVSSLNLAEKLGIKSLAFPAFGTGVGGFPMTACANLMEAAVRGYQPVAKHLERVVFCMFDELGVYAFTKAAGRDR